MSTLPFILPSLYLIPSSAAQVAMAILRNGGSAVEAVEMALMVLEDADITNSGYGSNLAIDGSVECDATIVDHKGRSGAVGAVASKSACLLRVSTCILFSLYTIPNT